MWIGFLPELGRSQAMGKRAASGSRGRVVHLQRADPESIYLATEEVTVGWGLTG